MHRNPHVRSLTRCRLTVKRSLLSFAQVHEGADGLRRGEAQDGVYHHLGDLADDRLTLAPVGRGHNPTDLVQQVNHHLLHEHRKKKEGEKGERHVSVDAGLELVGTPLTSVLSLGIMLSRVLKMKMQMEHCDEGCTGRTEDITTKTKSNQRLKNNIFF